VILDIGGEGRHRAAWNLNPRTHRTCGPRRGEPIPRLIHARGDRIPLADRSVDVLIVERTPLLRSTLDEIKRVARPSASVILRHALSGVTDPHRLALQVLEGTATRSITRIGGTRVNQTVVRM
jgi:hypothetical protein